MKSTMQAATPVEAVELALRLAGGGGADAVPERRQSDAARRSRRDLIPPTGPALDRPAPPEQTACLRGGQQRAQQTRGALLAQRLVEVAAFR